MVVFILFAYSCIFSFLAAALAESFPKTAEPAGEGGAASQATSRTEALGDAEGVSAGRTSPAPLLIPTQKPGNHRRGPPRGKDQATGHQKPHDASENMRQMLKEMQQAGEEVDAEAGHKAAFPRGSSGSVPASAAGREAMPGTDTGDEGAGKASPSAWRKKVLKPLEPPADVSTGRTSPAPTLDAALKPSSHHRGTPTGKIQDRTDKMSLQPSKQMRQELKEPLQTRQEMGIVLQWKVAFLEGSTPSSVPAPAAGRKAKPDTGTGTADWDAGTVPPLAWHSEVVMPSKHSAGVSAGTTSPTPTFDTAQKASSHGREMKGEPVQMEALPRGSSGSVAASTAGREAMPGTDTGAEPAGEDPTSRTEALGDAEGVSAGRTSQAPGLDAWPQPSSHGRGKTQDTAAKTSHEADEFLRQTQKQAPRGQDAAGITRPVPNAQDGLGRGFCQGRGCWLGLLAGVLSLELVFMLCCFGIGYSWNRKQSTSPTSQDQPNTSVMENLACHHASPCQCPLSLPQVYYQLVAGSMLQPLPRTDPSLPEGNDLAAHPG
ncbi:mucin-4-like isoform X2 [Passer domesticus]|uniref:mucin-4-like isoform X2 n=1 Tax=Passer domesticus TaxID=48849 RepID=UPI0030FED943